MTTDFAFYRPVGGANTAGQADRVGESQSARMVNGRIDNESPTTRLPVRCIPMSGDAAEFFATLNFQGGMRYNPAEGQGAITFGADESSILVSCGGRKLKLSFEGAGVNTSSVAEDVSNGLLSNPDLHLVCWEQAENYAIAADGNSNTWIWSGADLAFNSPGYNNVDKENSRIPNGCMAMCFVHGRLAVVVNGRAVLLGDLLNERDLTSAIDVTYFRAQTYFATQQYFSPPTRMGSINAMKVLPVQDTAHGHGELMVHEWNGIFSIASNVWPRSAWSSTPMVKTAYIGGGATGPYAVAIYSGDQFFRSRSGVQTLRSARAENSRPGAPEKTIAETVGDFLKGDSKRWLRFCSVETWQEQRRGMVTVYPIVAGRYRWHRGFIVCNFDPVPVQMAPSIWEGLWTLPAEIGGPVQFISGQFGGEERCFAVCYSPKTKRNTLVEFREDLIDDVLPDGSKRRIRSQLITRRMDALQPGKKKNWESASLYLSDVRGRVDWGVWVRSFGSREWTFWRSGYVENCADCAPGECGLCEPPPWEGEIPLGTLENLKGKAFKKTAKNIQFLVRWAGKCSLECMVASFDNSDPDSGKMKESDHKVKIGDCNRGFVEYEDYEYSDVIEADSWLKTETK